MDVPAVGKRCVSYMQSSRTPDVEDLDQFKATPVPGLPRTALMAETTKAPE